MTPKTFIEERDEAADQAYFKLSDGNTIAVNVYDMFEAGYNAALSSNLVKQVVSQVECWCEIATRSGYVRCPACDALAAYEEAVKELT